MLTLRGRIIPAETRLDMFSRRAIMTDETLNTINYLDDLWFLPRLEEIIIMVLVVAAIGIGIAILWNQRKIRKELHQLRELLDQKEGKPE